LSKVDDKIRKWRRWLAAIGRDLTAVLEAREICGRVPSVVGADVPGREPMIEVIGDLYAQSAALAVRRQLKLGSRNMSLAGLLSDIAENASVLTEERVSRLASSSPAEARAKALEVFDSLALESGEGLDPGRVQGDLEKLRNKTRSTVHYADRRVAHIDRRYTHDSGESEAGSEAEGSNHAEATSTPSPPPDLDSALLAVHAMAVKYSLLLACANPAG
jgi:hypothetical protein